MICCTVLYVLHKAFTVLSHNCIILLLPECIVMKGFSLWDTLASRSSFIWKWRPLLCASPAPISEPLLPTTPSLLWASLSPQWPRHFSYSDPGRLGHGPFVHYVCLWLCVVHAFLLQERISVPDEERMMYSCVWGDVTPWLPGWDQASGMSDIIVFY